MKFITYFFNFFKDLILSKKNFFHSSKESTYIMMRFLYKFSDGLILYILNKILIKNSNKPSKFNQGYKILEKISSQKTNDLKEQILKMKIKTINSNKTSEKLLRFKDDQIDYEYYHQNKITKINFDNEDLLKNEMVAKYTTDKNFIKICENILGSKPYITGITSWITLPATFLDSKQYDDIKKFESSQMWHRDCDYLRDIKLMTYLTDVIDENDGPFEIIKNTHSFNFFNPFVYEMGLAMRVGNNYIKKKFKEDLHSFFGNGGTTYLVDTRNLHRGKTIKRKNHYRLTLQIYITNSLFGNKIVNPKLNNSWQSFRVWQNAINESDTYKTLFSK